MWMAYGMSEIFLQDIRNATLLVRPGEQNFRFAHRSVQEYFLADEIHGAICEGRGAAMLDISVPSLETFDFILGRLEIGSESERRSFHQRFPTLMTKGHTPKVRDLAFALWLRSTATLPRPVELDLSDLDFFRRVLRGTENRFLPLQNSLWRDS
jgi:hypothetical protein